jgi:predicted small lipoprotein YifL
MNSFLRTVTLILLVAALAGPLAACGKKGPPIPPDGQDSDFPRRYPTS